MENVNFRVLSRDEMLLLPVEVRDAIINAVTEMQVQERISIKDPFTRVQMQGAPYIKSVNDLYSPIWNCRWCDVCVLFDSVGNPISVCRITSDEQDPSVLTLTSMITIKEHRRKGYGLYHLEQVKQFYSKTGHTIINLCFNAYNQDAKALYEKSGFLETYTYASVRIGV